jgi:hypothetical protein
VANGGKHGAKYRAARILGKSKEYVKDRIRGNNQLNAIYNSLITDAKGMQPPTQGDVMTRNAEGLPPEVLKIDVLDMVTDAERMMHMMGLKKAGIPEDTLKQLKALKGLASTTGHFIAQSLEMTSRSYYLQVLKMMGAADALHARLMAKDTEPGYVANDESRAMFNKNYIEFVKEAGRAFELMLTAATSMVKMMADANDIEMPGGKKKKPGWAIVSAPKAPPKPRLEPMPQ